MKQRCQRQDHQNKQIYLNSIGENYQEEEVVSLSKIRQCKLEIYLFW